MNKLEQIENKISDIVKLILEEYGIDVEGLNYESLHGIRERFLDNFFEKFGLISLVTRLYDLINELLDLLEEYEIEKKLISKNVEDGIDSKLEIKPKNKLS